MPDVRLKPREFFRRWQAIRIPEPSTMRGRRRWIIPDLPGVYAIYRGARLVYIGSTRRLLKRIAAHVNSVRWTAGLTVKAAVTFQHWEDRERRLVARLRPPDNCCGNPSRYRRHGFTDWVDFGSR